MPDGLLDGRLASEPPTPRGRWLRLLVLPLIAGLLLALSVLPTIGGLGLAAKAGADSFNDLPGELVAPPLPERSVFTDRTGRPIATLHDAQDRINVPLSRIPIGMRKAIVAIEDRRFYEHHGVDYRGVVRAALTNQENGAVTQGGSTLTQQYVKNVLITLADTDEGKEAAGERSLRRKLREARYAIGLEKQLSKDQILANYLNIAYFGDGAYGVASAAQHYFGKDISAVTPPEAALLAGLVQNPSAYNPKLHPKPAKRRRDTVLAAMRDAGYLTGPAYNASVAAPVRVVRTTAAGDGCESAGSAAFFCQYLRQTLLSDPRFGPTPEERQRRLFEGGLRIQTSLDPAVQAAAQSAADAIIPAGNRVATAVVILQPGTGEVQAMAVNRVYGATTDGKPVERTADRVHTKLNYALRPFQPGSTFKVFTLAAALNQGLPLSTTFDSPACYHSSVFNNPAGSGCFKNAADSETGVFTMPQATWHSVNTYFLQLEERVGVGSVRDMAKTLGVTSPRLDDVGPVDGSLTLGTFEATPLDMATAYATIAAHGKRCLPKPVLAVRERNHRSGYTGPGGCQQVLDPAVADTVSDVLQGVIREGTAAQYGSIGRPAAGKTGTTEENRSAWFVGYVPQLAASVWVGDYRSPDTFPLRYSPTTPEGVPVPGWSAGTVFGGGLPTEVWARAMRAATASLPVVPFPVPGAITAHPRTAAVPSVTGLDRDAAFGSLQDAGFVPVDGGTVASALPEGAVVSTDPAAGAQAPIGSTVLVRQSTGTPPVPAQTSTAPDGSADVGGQPAGGVTATPSAPSAGDPSPTATPSANPDGDLPTEPPDDSGVGAGDPTFGPDARASRG